MKVKCIAKTKYGQDGAIFGNLLFRFDHTGLCSVYDLEAVSGADTPRELAPIAEFTLDRADRIAPHGNAVVFGSEYYAYGDEFPLLYNNIYNNYAKSEDKLVGVCCVYRIIREGVGFSSQLVGLIEIGFTDDPLWRSEGVEDVRPYGNFVVDRERGRYYAFVMRDGDRLTRYFAFDLPSFEEGELDAELGVRRVRLQKEDVKEYFDVPYHNFIQGACMKDGKIYEVEGFHKDIHPAVRVIDTEKKREIFHFDFFEGGFELESELIDFLGDTCIYSDAHGGLFEIDFEGLI